MQPHPERKAEFWVLHLNTDLAELQKVQRRTWKSSKICDFCCMSLKGCGFSLDRKKLRTEIKLSLTENRKVVNKEDLELQFCN